MTESGTERLESLERQLRDGWGWLRFAPALEAGFQQQYRVWALPFRLTLIVIAAILIAVTPLLDLWLLHPPEEFMRAAHFSQLAIMLPALVVAGACSTLTALRGWADATGLLAVTIVASGLLYQRHLGAQYGVWVPTELITVTMAGAYVMGGLGFWRMTPLAVLLVCFTAASEVVSYGSNPTTQYIIFGVTVQFLIAGLAGYLQERFARDTWLRGEMLTILATQDSLTGLLNFRAFEQRYHQLFSLALRENKPVLVVLLDLDYFKQYNDTYGHAAGNTCLRRIAHHLAFMFRREADVKARMGGEEFVLVIYDIDRTEAGRVLEELRASIEALAIAHERSPLAGRVVTASLGAQWCAPRASLSADLALREADRCLYAAKDAGRNCVIFSDDEPRSAVPMVVSPA